jgi:hypothetical protein
VEFENVAALDISQSAKRALHTHNTVVDGAYEWLRAKLADDGLELVTDH